MWLYRIGMTSKEYARPAKRCPGRKPPRSVIKAVPFAELERRWPSCPAAGFDHALPAGCVKLVVNHELREHGPWITRTIGPILDG